MIKRGDKRIPVLSADASSDFRCFVDSSHWFLAIAFPQDFLRPVRARYSARQQLQQRRRSTADTKTKLPSRANNAAICGYPDDELLVCLNCFV